MSYTSYVDMDEVLCDFIGGVCKLTHTTREELESIRTPGDRGIDDYINELTGEDMWTSIGNKGESFWSELEPLPWFNDVKRMLTNNWEWTIVTTPKYSLPESLSGKMKWIHRHVGNYYDPIFSKDKSKLSRPGCFLLDDKPSNCENFAHPELGGKSVLFPNHGNKKHWLADNPLECKEVVSLLTRTMTSF